MTLNRRTSRAMPVARIALVMAASALTACSSSTDPAASAETGAATPASVEVSTTLAGTVAIGAPMSGATLKIVDADGVVVVSGLTVGADGRYAGVALTGKAPWTLEACGHAGSDWTCLSSVVQSPGTGNVTPLTDAVLRLAGSASAAAAGTVSDAMRTGLAALLADAGLPADFDFVTGALDAGSRGGYDRLLDAVGVSVGEDGKSFVQISPRLGSGNFYLESGGTAVGALALDPKASALPLAGLETLFRNMSASLAGASACAAESTGLRRSMAADARLSMGQG